MKKATHLTIRLSLILGMLLLYSSIYAKHEVYQNSLTTLSVNTPLNVKDDKYNSVSSSVLKRVNRVVLKLQELPKHNYSVKVNVTINYYNNTLKTNVSVKKSLFVNFDVTKSYKELDVYTFEDNCESYSVTINSIQQIGAVTGKSFVKLQTEILVDRYYNFDITNKPSPKKAANVLGSNEAKVEWSSVIGAEEYDLEWTWVENFKSDGTAYQNFSEKVINSDPFNANATRITTSDSIYKIPLIYERGFLIWRVRAVGTHDNNRQLFKYGNWNINFTNGTSWYLNNGISQVITIENGNEAGLNWQYSAQYAEEGKRKSTVSYFDGSLRNRQTQTKLNSQNEAVATETIYDAQGRPVIKVAPAPTSQAGIGYKPNFILNEIGVSYGIQDFDISKSGDDCNSTPGRMSLDSGAAKYYSPKNDSVHYAHHKFIPDAQGYPFTQVEYTPDNTGRIRNQGGIGNAFKLGSGHETKYLYSTPTQSEMVKLFGSEVGNESHYKKNVVVDANGQASVTYLDMQGKTIATALVGKGAKSQEDISTNLQKVTETMIDSNTPQIIDGTKKIYNREILVEEPDVLTLSYNVTPAQYKAICSENPTQPRCYDCVVDISFMLTDECGQKVLLNSQGEVKDTIGIANLNALRKYNYTYPATGVIPQKSIVIDKKSTNTIPVGTYTVTKVLTIDNEALEKYTQKYIKDSSSCMTPFGTFLQIEMAKADTTNCHRDCQQCLDHFDTYEVYFNKCQQENQGSVSNCLSPQEYISYKNKQCEVYCNKSQPACDQSLVAMLADVSPMGQYGTVSLSSQGNIYSNSNLNPVSLYSDTSKLPPSFVNNIQDGLWRHPCHFEKDLLGMIDPVNANSQNLGFYYNNNGEKDLIRVYWDGTDFSPKVVSDVLSLYTTNKTDAGYYYIRPEQLANVSDFIARWPIDGSWAKSLVVYHPEFKNLQTCRTFEASYEFDDKLLSYTKYSDIRNSIYSNFLDNPMIVDPLFTTTGFQKNEIYYNSFAKGLRNYVTPNKSTDSLSIWELAYVTILCPTCTRTAPCDEWCLDGKNVNNFKATLDNDVINQDALWADYKMMYLSLKRKLIEKTMVQRSIPLFAYNGCIGDTTYNVRKDGFNRISLATSTTLDFYSYKYPGGGGIGHKLWKSTLPSGIFQYLTNESKDKRQACYYKNSRLYAKKTPRFPRFSSAAGTSQYDVDICYEEPSVAEFDTAFKQDVNVVDCQDKNKFIIDQLQKNATKGFLESCGQCPITQEFSNFFRAIFAKMNKNHNYSNPIQLSCYPKGIAEYTTTLQNATNLDPLKIHNWQIDPSDFNTQKLKATISDGTSTCNITLKLKSSYDLPDVTGTSSIKTITFASIVDFCCMEYLDKYSILDKSEFDTYVHKRFSIGAWVIYEQSNHVLRKEQIVIEGYSDKILIDQCDLTLCNNSPLTADLCSFINALCFPTFDANNNLEKLFVKSTVNISETENSHLLESITDNIQNCAVFNNVVPISWQYRSSKEKIGTSTILNIELEKSNGGGVLHFRLMFEDDQQTSFESIEDVQYYMENTVKGIPTTSVSNPTPNPTRNLTLLVLGYFGSSTIPQRIPLYLESPDLKLLDCTDFGYKKKNKR